MIVSVPPSLREQYQIDGEIGTGASATVYAAHDIQMDRRVALKLYNEPMTAKHRRGRSSLTEAQLADKVRHPNVVPIYHAGLAEGRLYLVMKLLRGGSLRDHMNRRKAAFPPTAALSLAVVMAEALQAVHDARILHLDLKPENILFDSDSRPYLSDFGIAKLLNDDGVVRQTYAIGTPSYAAPEQRGHGQLGRSADVFSLGVVLFEMLTGYVPVGPAPEDATRSHSPPFRPYDPLISSRRLVGLLYKALQSEPSRRYATASDFCAAMRDVVGRADETTDRLDLQRQPDAGQARPHVVRFTLPNTRFSTLETSDARPHLARDLRGDLVPIPARTEVNHTLYSHHGLEIGRNALLNQPAFARGTIQLGRNVIARQDLISLTSIEIRDGAQLKNVIAPTIVLHGAVRVIGSLFCHGFTPSGGTALPHIHSGTEIGGCIVLGEDFANLVAESGYGRPINVATAPQNTTVRPTVRIAPDCLMVGVLGDANVILEPQQRAINMIRVSGDVVVRRQNVLQRVEGRNIHIEAGCQVEEIYARGSLVIDEGCRVGFIRASKSLRLGARVRVAAPIITVDHGRIIADESAQWQHDNEQPLSNETLFTQIKSDGGHGMVATSLLDHRLRDLYAALDPAQFSAWVTPQNPGTTSNSGAVPPENDLRHDDVIRDEVARITEQSPAEHDHG